ALFPYVLSVLALRRSLRCAPLLVMAALVACSPGGGATGGGNRIVTPPPAAARANPSATPAPGAPAAPGTSATPTPAGTTRIRGEGLSATELYTAYRAILDTYVDPVDDTQLVKAATDSLRQGLQNQVALPMVTLPLQLAPPPTGNVDKDWQAFGDAYESIVTRMPDWAGQAHPDWMVLRGMADSLHDGHTSFLT